MKKLAIISQKGGSGKTTLAVNLAVAATRTGRQAILIDLDPQASAAAFSDTRDAEQPVIVSAQAARLEPVLQTAEDHRAGLAVMDTPPHSEDISLTTLRVADFVLIPCRPAVLDLRAIKSSIEIARLAGVNFAIVLNCVPPLGHLTKEAIDVVKAFGAPVCPVAVGSRIAFVHAMTDGLGVQEYEPQGKAAAEIERLYKWLRRKI